MGQCASKRKRHRKGQSPRHRLSGRRTSVPVTEFQLSTRPVNSDDERIYLDPQTGERVKFSSTETKGRDPEPRDAFPCTDRGEDEDHYDHIDDSKLQAPCECERQQCEIYEEMVKIFRPLITKNLTVRDILPYLSFLEDEGRVLEAEKKSPQLAVTYLLDELGRSRELRKWKRFIEALEVCGYEYIVENIRGIQTIDNRYQVYYLRTLRPMLSHMIRPRELLPPLCAEGIITDNARQEIEQEETNHGTISAALMLLDKIPRKGTFWYTKFVKVLKDEHMDNIAEYLEIPELLDCTDQTVAHAKLVGCDTYLHDMQSFDCDSSTGIQNSNNSLTCIKTLQLSIRSQRSRKTNDNARYVKSPTRTLSDQFLYKSDSSRSKIVKATTPSDSISSLHGEDNNKTARSMQCSLVSTRSELNNTFSFLPQATRFQSLTKPQHYVEGPYETPDTFINDVTSSYQRNGESSGNSPCQNVVKEVSGQKHKACPTVSTNCTNKLYIEMGIGKAKEPTPIINIPVNYGVKEELLRGTMNDGVDKTQQAYSAEVQVDLTSNQPDPGEEYLEPCVSKTYSIDRKQGGTMTMKGQPLPPEEYSEPFEMVNFIPKSNENGSLELYPEHYDLQKELREIEEENKKLKKETELLQRKSSMTKERADLLRRKSELHKEIENNETETRAMKLSLSYPPAEIGIEDTDAFEAEYDFEAQYDLYKLYKRKTAMEFAADESLITPFRTLQQQHSHLAHADPLKLYDFSSSKTAKPLSFLEEDSAIFSDFNSQQE